MSNRKSRRKNQPLNFQRLEPRQVLASLLPTSVVTGQHVFYNDSAFDGNDASASAADDSAIATDKVALLPGQTATYQNISNFSKGINGIIIDANLANAAAFSASDIVLSTGIGNSDSDFTVLGVTPDVSVRVGQGVGGSDRITIVLPNRSVTNEFLQVTLLANSNTGASADDVFYFGSIVGDTGNSLSNTFVDAIDIGEVESNLTGFSIANVENNYDINRDQFVDAIDIGEIESNLSGFLPVNLITAPAAPVVQATGNEFFVSSASEINSAVNQAQPGDTIVLENGTYTNLDIDFSTDGTQQLPITFRAETPGQVILTGSSTLDISGDWLVVDGLSFEGGAISSGNIISFRGSNGNATNSRLTNSQIVDYNPSNESTRYFWVGLYGTNNRVDHNTFSGQNHSGVTVVVWRNGAAADHHLIDNNHFNDRPEGSGNGFETIRVGDSNGSLSDSFTTIDNNLFERQDGEIEIISVKAGRVNVTNNTFLESAGTLTLRHGNNSVVEGNFFIGNNKDRSGGVRIIGDGHRVVNNYFEGLDGRADGAISIAAGVEGGPLNSHDPVENLLIAHNTIVNLNDGAAIAFSEGFNNDNGAGNRTDLANNVTIANNLISTFRDPIFGGLQGTNFTFQNNITFGSALGSASGTGNLAVNPLLTRGADGVVRLTSSSPAVDAAFATYAESIDIDGHQRIGAADIGADEFSTAAPLRGPLQDTHVGNCFDATGNVTPVTPPPTNPPTNPPVNPGTGVIPSGLIVEAEDFTAALDPNNDGDTFTVSSESGAHGGSVVVAPGGNRVTAPNHDAVLDYSLQFAEAGTFTVYIRGRGFSGSTDSFFAGSAFGQSPDDNTGLTSDGSFDWERGSSFQVSSANVNAVLQYSIGKREAGAEIDAIVFHLDSNLSDSELDAFFA